MKKILSLLTIALLFFVANAAAQSRSLKYDFTDAHKYSDNMTMTCIVRLDGALLPDCELAAFDAEGELRGAMLSDTDDEGRIYLTVQGDTADEPIAFRVVYGAGHDVPCFVSATFRKSGIVGSYGSPYVIDISAEASIADVARLVDALRSGTASKAVHDTNADDCLSSDDVSALADKVLKR